MSDRPRRAEAARWLTDAPPYVLDCFDLGPQELDRFDVLLTAFYQPSRGDWFVPYLSLNDWGASYWGELDAAEAARYRRANGRRRVRWLALPERVRAAVVARYAAEA